MKFKRTLLTSIATIALAASFVAGLITGNTYKLGDILCPAAASPHTLKSDFKSNNGIFFPKGTVVPVRKCAYMQRFEWSFAIDNDINLNPSVVVPDGEYGFSVLSKAEE